ncbi:limonene hydroxylase [Peptococcaceae bacterium CEB3]|nr:limonene hydroxylase [Peptococcaceae bacterium CEB3]
MRQKAERIKKAWSQFIEISEIEPYVVGETVANSWQRCWERQLNPYAQVSQLLNQREIFADQQQGLITLSKPFMHHLYNFIRGSNFLVVLADNLGVLVEVLGDPVVKQKVKHRGLVVGVDWSEISMGTNAIGLALIEKKPLEVFATEHYCRVFHDLTGAAAPFLGPTKELLGVLALFGIYEDYHPHSLGMVVAAVRAIENQSLYNNAVSELALAYDHVKTIIETMSEGLIHINREGLIINLNSVGGKILGLNPENCLGHLAKEVFGENFLLLDVLKNGRIIAEREVVWENGRDRRRFTMNGKPFITADGSADGVIATLRGINTVHKLVNSIVGAEASLTFDDIIGSDDKLLGIISRAKRVARSGSTVLLEGESGTGKELFAQAIHNFSARKNGPFVVINCAAIPRELVESELFGYEEGSFTGARRGGRPGKFELCSGGTIFLDEIGDMPLEIQASLLRVLQERRVTRIGGERTIPINTRVISATHKDLAKEVERGNFRLDLFYRLNVISLTIPSLRQRRGDISTLTNYLVETKGKRLGLSNLEVSQEYYAALENYDWPGNVRELENVVEQSLFLAESGLLLPQHLPERITSQRLKLLNPGQGMVLRQHEANLIRETLTMCNGNVSHAAKILGIGRNTLYRKLRQN